MPKAPDCIIEPLNPAHLPRLAKLVVPEAGQGPQGAPRPRTPQESPSWLRRAQREIRAGRAEVFGVVSARLGLVGVTRLDTFTGRSGSANLSYWIAPWYRRRGFAATGASQTLEAGRRQRRLLEARAWTPADNAGSVAVLRRLGFEELPPFRPSGKEESRAPVLPFVRQLEPLPDEAETAAGFAGGVLKLRPEQVQALFAAPRREQARNLLPEVRRRYPSFAALLGEEELFGQIYGTMERARTYGLAADRDLRAFAFLSFSVHPFFDLYPPFQTVLTDSKLAPAERLAALFETAGPADWRAAGHGGEPQET